jgi:hypothetical protein
MKRVLIITYYWPPSGGAGVQRWLKFTKYLRDFGWEPVIYTPENPESPINDPTLEKDVPKDLTVIKTEIWEPYLVYKKMIGQKKNEKINAAFLSESKKPKRLEKIAVWVRGNFFIPDARAYWIKPSAKFLAIYLSKNKVDAMVSTGPPHSMHLIALELKKKLNIPWVADFRDPWTEIDFYSKLMLSPWADKKHKALELSVLQRADAISCVGQNWLDGLEAIYKKSVKGTYTSQMHERFNFISNGYDPEDYTDSAPVVMDKKFSLAHIGTLDKSRNPELLWKVLAGIMKKDPDFAKDLEIKLVGKVDISVLDDIQKYGLTGNLNKIPYLSHHDVTKVQKQTHVLMLLVNRTPNAMGITTGKFFEYMAAHRPILCLGPIGGDADKILHEVNGGLLSDWDDAAKLEENILYFYSKYKQGNVPSESKGIEKYSRKALTQNVANLLNRITY